MGKIVVVDGLCLLLTILVRAKGEQGLVSLCIIFLIDQRAGIVVSDGGQNDRIEKNDGQNANKYNSKQDEGDDPIALGAFFCLCLLFLYPLLMRELCRFGLRLDIFDVFLADRDPIVCILPAADGL